MEKGKYLGRSFPGSSLFGEQNKMFAPNSFCLGRNLETKNEGEVAIGKFNSSTKRTGENNGTVFSVGGGTAEARKNLFEIKEDGSVNLGGNDISHPAKDYGWTVPDSKIIHRKNDVAPEPWTEEKTIDNPADFASAAIFNGAIRRFDSIDAVIDLIDALWPEADYNIYAVWFYDSFLYGPVRWYVLLDGNDGTEGSEDELRLLEIED